MQFSYQYGSSTETFASYIALLIKALKEKYPDQDFLLVLDNLAAHQTSETVKAMQDPRARMMFIPAYTPEFSPIENFFGLLKKKLRETKFSNKEVLAKAIMDKAFSLPSNLFESCYRHSINEMKKCIQLPNTVELLGELENQQEH